MGNGESLACSTNNGESTSRAGICIRENRDVSGAIISQKMNLKKPGYQFKQQTKALEPWKGKSPACSRFICADRGAWGIQGVCTRQWKSTEAPTAPQSESRTEQLGRCSQPWVQGHHHNHSPVFPGLGSQPTAPTRECRVNPSLGGVNFYYFIIPCCTFPHSASPTLSPCLNTCLASIACLQDKSAVQILLYFGSLTTAGQWHWNGEMGCCSCWSNVTHMFHQPHQLPVLHGGNRRNSVFTIWFQSCLGVLPFLVLSISLNVES